MRPRGDGAVPCTPHPLMQNTGISIPDRGDTFVQGCAMYLFKSNAAILPVNSEMAAISMCLDRDFFDIPSGCIAIHFAVNNPDGLQWRQKAQAASLCHRFFLGPEMKKERETPRAAYPVLEMCHFRDIRLEVLEVDRMDLFNINAEGALARHCKDNHFP